MQLEWIEIRGFRAFGTTSQKIELSPVLTLVRAENSQGKTSFSEAVEFLFSGTTSRRDLHTGAKAEFDGCLRNAHLPAGEDVWVQAQFKLPDGSTTIVRRTLLTDYDGATECTSELTRDGITVTSIEEIGVELSGHDLAAPVLQQHVLDFVAAAPPQERANYFKALLDLTDLEIIRSNLAEHASNLELPPTTLITTLTSISQSENYTRTVRQVFKSTAYDELEKHLMSLGNTALKESGHKTTYKKLAEVVEELGKIVRSRVAKIISLTDLALSEIPEVAIPSLDNATGEYIKASDKMDEEVARLVPIFKSVLDIPKITHAEHEGEVVDCPVCGSENTLTPARVGELRKHLAANSSFNEKAVQAETALNRISSTITTGRTNVKNTTPPIVNWSDEQKDEFKKKAIALGIPDELTGQVISGAFTIGKSLEELYQEGEDVRRNLSALIQSVKARSPLDKNALKELGKSLDAFSANYKKAKDAIDTHIVLQEQLQDSINKRAEEQSGTKTWSEIVSICKQPDEVLEDIKAGRALKKVKQRYEKACAKIDKAVVDVFNTKFGAMSDEVVAWWKTLRPDELTSFDGVKMRGTGRRWFDLKATLRTAPGSSGVLKDAVSVFSNSQLNALGLSSFLARCSIQKTPFVVLDDPIPSGDTEHRLTFAINTVPRMLDACKAQVIVTVYDTLTAQQLNDAHVHRGINYYEVTLKDPVGGSEVKPVSDEFHNRLATAATLMHNPNTDVRKLAGQNLRDAAERLSKQIIVSELRKAGGTASVADYDGKTMGELKPLVTPYSAKPEEPGLWAVIVRELNPADHDTNPPTSAALKLSHDTLKQLEKLHPEAKKIRR